MTINLITMTTIIVTKANDTQVIDHHPLTDAQLVIAAVAF